MKIIDVFVHVFFGAVGFFDFESIQGFGMDDAFDFVMVVDHWKISKTRFVEFI